MESRPCGAVGGDANEKKKDTHEDGDDDEEGLCETGDDNHGQSGISKILNRVTEQDKITFESYHDHCVHR